jgi:hypothetical protein
MAGSPWVPVRTKEPPEGEVVQTKIHDRGGCRNEQPLKRQGSLYFFPDGSMYVYYTPTHWRATSGHTNDGG